MKKIISSSELRETLSERYATKVFDASKPISLEDEAALLESLRLSPSSYGLQPWKWVVVRDKELRSKLRAVSWNQAQVEEAPLYIVFAFKEAIDPAFIEKFVESTEKIRSLPAGALAGYKDMMVTNVANGKTPEEQKNWAARQVYISTGFLGLSAAMLGIDTCILEGFDPASYDNLLGLEGTGYKSVVAVALGYRSEDDKYASLIKSRFDADEVIEVR